jgi:hypothetical protein
MFLQIVQVIFELTLSAINITAANDITIAITGDASSDSINRAGTGVLRITGEAGKTLTLNSTLGPAINASGDIVIDGDSDVYAGTTASGSAAIESETGSVTIKDSAGVEAYAGTDGSAIKAATDIIISTNWNVKAAATGNGYALEAGNEITITNGMTELVASDDAHAFSVTPSVSGDGTSVNGDTIYGDGDAGDGAEEGNGTERSGGGCDAGSGTIFASVLAAGFLSLIRSNRGKQ